MHEQKLTKLRQYLTVFPSHFSNIFTFTEFNKKCVILQKLIRFHETNDISQNFSSITVGFREISKYFVDFWFRFQYFQKMTPKFWFRSYRLKILKF